MCKVNVTIITLWKLTEHIVSHFLSTDRYVFGLFNKHNNNKDRDNRYVAFLQRFPAATRLFLRHPEKGVAKVNDILLTSSVPIEWFCSTNCSLYCGPLITLLLTVGQIQQVTCKIPQDTCFSCWFGHLGVFILTLPLASRAWGDVFIHRGQKETCSLCQYGGGRGGGRRTGRGHPIWQEEGRREGAEERAEGVQGGG